MDQLEDKHKQLIKLSSSMRTLANLELTAEHKEIMKNSMFYKLLRVEDSKQSSASLVSELCRRYDKETQKYVLNNETSFSFCIKEVAYVLGIEDTGTDFIANNDRMECPDFVAELRERILHKNDNKVTASDLKMILTNMSIDDDKSKLHFRQLLSFFLLDQILLCSSNPKIVLFRSWWAVHDLEAFEQFNWAKAIFNHLNDSVGDLKERMVDLNKQHFFKGFAPVLETIIYERIPSMAPPRNVVNVSSELPIHKYAATRKKVGKKLDELTAVQINSCPWCDHQELSLVVDGACSPSPSLVKDAAKDADSLAPSLGEDDVFSLSPSLVEDLGSAAPEELENLRVSPSLVEDAEKDAEEDECSLAPGEIENMIVRPSQPPHLSVRKSTRVQKNVVSGDDEDYSKLPSREEHDDEEKDKQSSEEEELPVENPKPIGEPVIVSREGKQHFHSFELGGKQFTIDDTVLLAPDIGDTKVSVAIIKDITQFPNDSLMISAQQLYRPDKAGKKGGGSWKSNNRELFYSLHRDEFPATTVMHRCVVHFIPIHKQLPKCKQHPGFIVQKMYDTKEMKLWNITDKDNRLQEIDELVQKTIQRMGELPDIETAVVPKNSYI